MTVRLTEHLNAWFTGGIGIEITADKIINLLIRDSNNLIKVNGDNEIYTDLQMANNPSVSTTFDVGITTGYVNSSQGRPASWQLVVAKTSDWKQLGLLNGNDGRLRYGNDFQDPDNRKYTLLSSDLDDLKDELQQWIIDLLEEYTIFVRVSTARGVENNTYMLKSVTTSSDASSAQINMIRRDVAGVVSSDVLSNVQMPVASETTAGVMTASVYNQVQSNSDRILNLEGLGEYLGLFETLNDRPTNVSEFTDVVPTRNDFIKIATDSSKGGVLSQYRIVRIAANGDITWDSGMVYSSTENYRVYATIHERDVDVNLYDGLLWYVQANKTTYYYDEDTTSWKEQNPDRVEQKLYLLETIEQWETVYSLSTSQSTADNIQFTTVTNYLNNDNIVIVAVTEGTAESILDLVLVAPDQYVWEGSSYATVEDQRKVRVKMDVLNTVTKAIIEEDAYITWDDVDTAMSDVSTNPVQNNTIKDYIDKRTTIGDDSTNLLKRVNNKDYANIESDATITIENKTDKTVPYKKIGVAVSEVTGNCIEVKSDGIYTQGTKDYDELINTPLYLTDKGEVTQAVNVNSDYQDFFDSLWQIIQVATLPTASADELGKIYQYIGATTSVAPIYTNGYFYKCVSDGAVTPTYSWEAISTQEVATSLADLSDTTITNPSNWEIAVFNGTSTKWENKNPNARNTLTGTTLTISWTNYRNQITTNANITVSAWTGLIPWAEYILRVSNSDTSNAKTMTYNSVVYTIPASANINFKFYALTSTTLDFEWPRILTQMITSNVEEWKVYYII